MAWIVLSPWTTCSSTTLSWRTSGISAVRTEAGIISFCRNEGGQSTSVVGSLCGDDPDLDKVAAKGIEQVACVAPPGVRVLFEASAPSVFDGAHRHEAPERGVLPLHRSQLRRQRSLALDTSFHVGWWYGSHICPPLISSRAQRWAELHPSSPTRHPGSVVKNTSRSLCLH